MTVIVVAVVVVVSLILESCNAYEYLRAIAAIVLVVRVERATTAARFRGRLELLKIGETRMSTTIDTSSSSSRSSSLARMYSSCVFAVASFIYTGPLAANLLILPLLHTQISLYSRQAIMGGLRRTQ